MENDDFDDRRGSRSSRRESRRNSAESAVSGFSRFSTEEEDEDKDAAGEEVVVGGRTRKRSLLVQSARLSEFERGVTVCLVILISYTVIMAVFYFTYCIGLSQKVHLLRVSDDPNSRVKFKSLGRPIALIEESFPFIGAIIDRVFLDDFLEYKFKCSAVLFQNNSVLAGNSCLSNTKDGEQTEKVRILSSLWSELGFTHGIFDHKNIKNSFVTIKLKNPFHNLDPKNQARLLTPNEFEKINTIEFVTSYCWDHSYFSSRDLRKRRRYEVLSSKELKIARDNECTNYPEDFDGLCAIENIDIEDFYDEVLDGRDSIFLKDSNKLIGIEVKREFLNNSIHHYYQFVKEIDFL